MDGRIYVVEFTDIVGFLGFFLVIVIAMELIKSVCVQVPDRTIHS